MRSPDMPLIELIPGTYPYGMTHKENNVSGGLPKANRDLSYAARYRLKEIGRERITRAIDIASRSQIGR